MAAVRGYRYGSAYRARSPAGRQRRYSAPGIAALAEQPLTALSGGQRQRAFLALLLAQDTPLVLLDEPTTWLDINHQVELMTLMRELRGWEKP
ncbi:iron(III) dicitrate transport ATP-binding protein FecE [Klebsiella grimontii]|uniref:Iron(III) dicitrate transport ATP-binding protein FecE n=1 Tax=Klebsiella grimontii TaxID=2058152 RepID=A0A7H4P5R7_9ENTR|nr:iron(III) dicitrate transport ATP-binding protein FecE [Klebsiella grimontii]